MNFWDNVRTEIQKQNTTQDWVANTANIKLATFQGWISRKRLPRVDQAVAIATALNTSVEYLVTGSLQTTSEKSDTRISFDRFIDTLDDQQIVKAHKILIEVFSGGKKEASSRSLA